MPNLYGCVFTKLIVELKVFLSSSGKPFVVSVGGSRKSVFRVFLDLYADNMNALSTSEPATENKMFCGIVIFW